MRRYEKDCRNSKWTLDKIFVEESSLGFISKGLIKF